MISNEELAAWVAGEADPAVAARIESSLPDDADLAARVDAQRVADDLLAGLPDVAPSQEAVQRIALASRRAASNHLDLEAARSGTARDRRGGMPGGSRPGIDWTGWTARVAALAAIVAVVAVGVGLERDTIFGTRLGASGDDSAAVTAGDADTADVEMAESLDAATEMGEAREEMAAPDVGEGADEAGDGTQAGDSTEAPAGTDLAARTVPAGRIDDDVWADLVGTDTPGLLAGPDGDVLLVEAGTRFDDVLDARVSSSAGFGDDAATADDGDGAFRQPATTVDAALVGDFVASGTVTATPVDEEAAGASPDGATTSDRVIACLARRSEAVDGMDPSAPPVEIVVAGTVEVGSSAGDGDEGGGQPVLALVDAAGGIVVVDATTCSPLGTAG